MAIRRRGDAFLVDVTVHGQRKYGTFPTEAEALVKEAEYRVELLKGVPTVSKKVWTLSEACDRTAKTIWQDQTKMHNRKSLMLTKTICAHFGASRPITELSTASIDAWIQSLRERKLTGGTINRYTACLSRVLSYAIECSTDSGLKDKPKLHHQEAAGGRQLFITEAQEAALVATMRHLGLDDQADMTIFLADTGARIGEAFKLLITDVDLPRSSLIFRDRKAGNTSGLPMTARVKEVLTRQIGNRISGKVWSGGYWRYHSAWERAIAPLGYSADKNWTPHLLRHTCASRLVQRGVPLKVVQEWMGHQTLAMTMRYAHLATAHLAQAVVALEANPAPVPVSA